MRCGVLGLGFEVWGFGFRFGVWGVGFGAWGLVGFRASGLSFYSLRLTTYRAYRVVYSI